MRTGASRKTSGGRLLHQDVTDMIKERQGEQTPEELAHSIIVVVRERVLRELASYARENVR